MIQVCAKTAVCERTYMATIYAVIVGQPAENKAYAGDTGIEMSNGTVRTYCRPGRYN